MKGKVLFCLFIIFFSFSSIFYAQAQEQKQPAQEQSQEELSLFEIDKLIRKTEYDEALRQLNIYIENNPDHFDNAQSRVERIMNAKIKYSELAEKLLDIIRNDPTNNKKIYEITAQLERFERHPSDENLKFIADLKKSAEFNYFRATFLEIQNDIAEYVEDGKYVEGVRRAQEGFWLYQESFYVEWEDYPDVIQKTENAVEKLKTHLARFEERNYISDFNRVINEFIRAVNNDQYDLALKRFETVSEKLKEYNNLRNLIIKDKEEMEGIVTDLQKIHSDMTDASYLPFIIHFVVGADSIENSGILGAVDGQWNSFIKQMNDSVFAMTTKKYGTFEKKINDDFTNNVKKYADLNLKVLDLYDIPNESSSFKIENPFTEYAMLSTYVSNLSKVATESVKKLAYVNDNEKTQNEVIKEIDESKEKNQDENIDMLFNYSFELEDKTGTKEQFDSHYNSWAGDYIKSGHKNWDELTDEYKSVVAEIFNKKDIIVKNTWNKISEYYKFYSEHLYTELVTYIDSAESYKKGFYEKVPVNVVSEIDRDITRATFYVSSYDKDADKNLGLHYCYPDISINLTDYVNQQIDLRVEKIDKYLELINNKYNAYERWREVDGIPSYVNNAKEFLKQQRANILSLRGRNNEVQTDAKNMIIASQLAKNEADIRFAEAERALKNEDFTTARKKLQNALTKYDEALNNQNNEDLRNEWDSKLKNLGDRIAKSENEVIVRQVRELKNAAKDAYFNGRFDDAETYLTQASQKWAITNVTEDPEIANLLNFVNTAISMKTGREILPSAPQYPEMSQLLNIAHQNFNEGKKLMEKGLVDEANEKFDISLDNIRRVQYVYPLNQEASLLTLRINQIKDPKKFKDEFSQKIQAARGMCKSNETKQEGYANLLDYYELDPNYPGLKDIIYNVEIEIGIRQKPVDNSGKIKAERYIAEARNLYSKAGSDLAKLNKALDKVNQALAVLPDSREAKSLKDEITTKMGGNASTILSTEDERLYQLAIQRLQNNNVVGAKAIVDALLKKPQNRYSKKIKDLKKKIDARL